MDLLNRRLVLVGVVFAVIGFGAYIAAQFMVEREGPWVWRTPMGDAISNAGLVLMALTGAITAIIAVRWALSFAQRRHEDP